MSNPEENATPAPAAPEVPKPAHVFVDELRALMERIEHDIIGQAHTFYQGLKALVEKAEAAL